MLETLCLGKADEEIQYVCEQAIRNYDPCISCATHFLTRGLLHCTYAPPSLKNGVVSNVASGRRAACCAPPVPLLPV